VTTLLAEIEAGLLKRILISIEAGLMNEYYMYINRIRFNEKNDLFTTF